MRAWEGVADVMEVRNGDRIKIIFHIIFVIIIIFLNTAINTIFFSSPRDVFSAINYSETANFVLPQTPQHAFAFISEKLKMHSALVCTLSTGSRYGEKERVTHYFCWLSLLSTTTATM